ncbi:hypothetical protein PTKIN_Ptkin14bG0099400 [Pterospermum kingtungense]
MDFLLSKIDESWDISTNLADKMNNLKRKLERLNALKEDTESRTRAELHPRKKLKKEVELWLTNVKRINGEIQDLEQKLGESSVVSRGFLKGNVFKKTQEVEALFEWGKLQDSLVVDDNRWIGQALSTTTLFGEAAKICMAKIWAYLMDDDVQRVGIWGMGGIGKTTIMKLVQNKLLKETKKFDIVLWITVSKEINIGKLQNKIERALNATLGEDEDEAIRAGMIHEMLARKGKYVIILDDLWDKLSLEEVGIPEPAKGSKLLMLGVCSRKKLVKKLSYQYLLPIVKSVAEECAGLPLAIVTIATSMKGVCNVHEWRNAVHELSRHEKSVNEIEEKVFQQLLFSYDRLQDEKLKHCFLCCALYPEDYDMDTKELTELWVAEGLLEEMDSMQIEIDKGHTLLNKLKNSCLVETVIDEYATRNKVKVKLHDIVRDMALRITSVRPRFLVRAGMQLKEIPDVQDWKEDLEKASFMENWGLLIPCEIPPPKCPNLTTLLLSKCSIESIPEDFFEQMYGLKLLDLSYNNFKSLSNSISNLKTLTTLLLGSCGKLEKVPSFSKLEALKKLDLEFTRIKDVPHGMDKLVNLKYLGFNGAYITEMGDGILAKLTSLQYLGMINGNMLMKGEEIGGLRILEMFEVRFGELNELNSYAQALQARIRRPRRYSILVSPQWDRTIQRGGRLIEINGYNICCANGIKIPSDVENLVIKSCSVDLHRKERALFSWFAIPRPLNTFSSLSEIYIVNCNIEKLFSSNWVLDNLHNLSWLAIEECDDMVEIIASEIKSETKVEEEGITSTTRIEKHL